MRVNELFRTTSVLILIGLLIWAISMLIVTTYAHPGSHRIEVYIDKDGKAAAVPNPAVVADGDTVYWHVQRNDCADAKKITVKLPNGPCKPFKPQFAQEDFTKDATPCTNVYPPPGTKIDWPEDCDEYTYEIKTSGSPEIVSYASLVRGTRVGGIAVLADKLALLAPYIAVASTIIGATAATAIYVKRVKRTKKKQ